MTNIKSATPKYLKIAENLISDILAKKFQVNDRLPTEKDLCIQYQVSRHTAREALRHVGKTGLIGRKQGSGSIVKRTSLPKVDNPFISSIDDLMQYGRNTIFTINSTKLTEVKSPFSELLKTNDASQVLEITGLRLNPKNKDIICFNQIVRLQQQDHYQQQLLEPTTTLATLSELLDVKTIGKVEQTITACQLDKTMAEKLKAKEGSAALNITRVYFDSSGDNITLAANSIYPEHRFSYSTMLYPS